MSLQKLPSKIMCLYPTKLVCDKIFLKTMIFLNEKQSLELIRIVISVASNVSRRIRIWPWIFPTSAVWPNYQIWKIWQCRSVIKKPVQDSDSAIKNYYMTDILTVLFLTLTTIPTTRFLLHFNISF